jgi:lysozyme
MKMWGVLVYAAGLWSTTVWAQTPVPDLGPESLSQSQVEDLKGGHALGAAEVASARPIGPVTVALIVSFEGWESKAYDDPSKYCTIGYGHLIALKPCAEVNLVKVGFAGTITKETGLEILYQDTTSARLAVRDLVQDSYKLNPDQFGALVSFTFNVGKSNFQGSTLRSMLNAGAYNNVPKELMKWVKSKGQILSGLIRRRACEGAHFRGVLVLNAKGSVDCPMPALGVASDINAIDIETGKQ